MLARGLVASGVSRARFWVATVAPPLGAREGAALPARRAHE